MAMLETRDLCVNYDFVVALKDVSIEADEGEIYSIIGSNGAGKTTLLRTISGLVKPKSGYVEFMGEKLPPQPHKIVQKGIVHVPEGRKTFSGLTVEDNLLVGAHLHKEMDESLEAQYACFPILRERRHQFAGTLSGGEQQMLAIARGLMSRPRIMLLDEPSLGLAPLIVNEVFELIKRIRDMGITIFVVEQNARKALSICDKACVLENGVVTVCGTGKDLLESDVVRRAYLGA